MLKKLVCVILFLSLPFAASCRSTLDSVNRDAKEVGETAGQVGRVPLSASEGVSEGIAGEAESNPYGR